MSASASAEVVHCSFTEPFFNLEIDTARKTLKKTEPDWNNDAGQTVTTILSRTVAVKRLAPKVVSPLVEIPRYQILSGGKPVMVLELSYQGSDGMSDFVFPYATKYDGHFGGCYSDKLPRHVFHYEEEGQ